MKFTLSNIIEKSWNDKKFLEATLTDEAGQTYEKVSFWSGEITPESTEISGELTKNDKGYWKLVVPKPEGGKRPNMDRIMEKKSGLISEAQEKKAENIAKAQDRNEWMYSKINASLLIANHPSFKEMEPKKIADAVISLATKLYNGEPTEPFN